MFGNDLLARYQLYLCCAHFRVSYICRNGAKSHRVCGENTACIQLVNISRCHTAYACWLAFARAAQTRLRTRKTHTNTHTGKLTERKGATKKRIVGVGCGRSTCNTRQIHWVNMSIGTHRHTYKHKYASINKSGQSLGAGGGSGMT